jgi:ATP-binding cassette, subfamily B, bacterial PglK
MISKSIGARDLFDKISELLTSQQRRKLVKLLGMMLVGMILETTGIGLVIPAISLISEPNLGTKSPVLASWLDRLGSFTQAQLVMGGVLMLVGVNIVKTVYLGILTWKQYEFIFRLQASLTFQLFTGYLRQPWSFHLERNTAELIRNVTIESNHFTNNVVCPAMLLMTEGLVLLGITILMMVVEPLGMVLVACVLGLAAWSFQRVTKSYTLRWGEDRQYHEGQRIQHLQQGLGGAKDVKLSGHESDFFAQFNTHSLNFARISQRQATMIQIPRLWLELLAVAGMAILVLVMLSQGRSPVDMLPTLGLFVAAAFRIMPSVSRVLNVVQGIRYGLPVVNTLHQEMQLLEVSIPPRNEGLISFKETLKLEKVSYQYSTASSLSIRNINLSIRYGNSVGFIGASGAGKSTLVDVILGLLTPTSGRITVDGVDIQTNLRGWQDQIGYVPQSIFLTDDTLRRNVAFGLPEEEINDNAVIQAIQAAQLQDYVESLPHGFNSFVGERGVRLSGGQRQRIGIARALYHGPSVLVLDEATSSLDNVTEESFMEAVNALQDSKTLLIVAHRLSTVAHCDYIYHLEKGKIVAEGLPDKLLKM